MADETTGTEAADATPGEPAAIRALRERWPDAIDEAAPNAGQWRVELASREPVVDMVRFLRDEPSLRFDFLVDVTGLDEYGTEPRFRAVYVLRSMSLHEDLVLKVKVPEEDIWAPSMTGLFATANWLEREAYDMYGIEFRDHPDLRRIMLPDVFQGYPLRKDFPMEGKMSDREWAEWIISRAQREVG